jgi:hypothetical protein
VSRITLRLNQYPLKTLQKLVGSDGIGSETAEIRTNRRDLN